MCGGTEPGIRNRNLKRNFFSSLFRSLRRALDVCCTYLQGLSGTAGEWRKWTGFMAKKKSLHWTFDELSSTLAWTLKNKNVGLPWILNFSSLLYFFCLHGKWIKKLTRSRVSGDSREMKLFVFRSDYTSTLFFICCSARVQKLHYVSGPPFAANQMIKICFYYFFLPLLSHSLSRGFAISGKLFSANLRVIFANSQWISDAYR